jgi:hypothetical protein
VELAEDFRHSKAGRESYAKRSETIERVFADAKEKHGMRYTLHKGLVRVSNWAKPKFAAMNLKKLALWVFRDPLFYFFHSKLLHKCKKVLFCDLKSTFFDIKLLKLLSRYSIPALLESIQEATSYGSYCYESVRTKLEEKQYKDTPVNPVTNPVEIKQVDLSAYDVMVTGVSPLERNT